MRLRRGVGAGALAHGGKCGGAEHGRFDELRACGRGDLAGQSYGVLVNPKGFAPDGAIDIEGVRRVLALRSEYGEPKKSLTDPMRYYDPRYYEAAKR